MAVKKALRRGRCPISSRKFATCGVQGCLAHKKQQSPRTLQKDHTKGPKVALGGGWFL